MSAIKQLQDLLRDLFQLEMADLDFGLYRLLRLKKEEIEAFLTEQLPRRVGEAFSSVAGEERALLEKEASELAERIRKEIAEDALLENGEINPDYKNIKAKAARELLESYRTKIIKVQSIQATDAQQAEVFNHLYNFFSRYYEAGDFIPRRRYGAREAYAVPYNGEETFFHWANKDQHYVKTTETFKDYAFAVDALGGPFRLRFLLTEASLPPGNTKGDTRYFFPIHDQGKWEGELKTFNIPFHYRLPVEEEVERYGRNSKLQEAILKNSMSEILEAIPAAPLRAALSTPVEEKDDQCVSLLLKRMRHFCRRNTSDYFIHKDLEGFLKQEIEFYLKDQVLHLADIEGDLEGKRRTLRVIRQLAEEIIAFLGQIEDVQKRLFEKKKFVLRTDYLVPIKEVPRELWKEILENKTQVEAWKTLFAIDPKKDLFNHKGKVNEQFLKGNPTLVVDTSRFGSEFKEKLLASFSDIDEVTDGLLIHAENYQALRFLGRKYATKVKCIYIDPPYNTGSDEFIYKDRYRHSSWLAMMETRLREARELLNNIGSIFISVNEIEHSNILKAADETFGPNDVVGTIIWRMKYTISNDALFFSDQHEYIVCAARNKIEWRPLLLQRTAEMDERYDNPDNDPNGLWKATPLHAKSGTLKEFSYKFSNGHVWSPPPGTYPRFSRETLAALESEGAIWFGKNGKSQPVRKTYLKDVQQGKKCSTFWNYDEVGHTHEANEELADVLNKGAYPNPKPTRLIRRVLQVGSNKTDIILDFFGGSGTSGQATINLNREDGGRRKFILVEMGSYFNSVLVPRIQKVIFTAEWKDGKPKRLPTKEEVERTPRLIKVLRLEGYEDALHNLVTDETLKREELRAKAHKERLGGDTYRLQYLVRLPLEASASMLNLAGLEHPFRYTIEILTEDGPKVETVDLVETFNFLYGLHVERLETWINNKDRRTYRAVKGKNREGHSVLVLWRDMEGFDPLVERQFLESKLKMEGPFDEIWINGDTATPGIKSLDSLFKRLLEEGER